MQDSNDVAVSFSGIRKMEVQAQDQHSQSQISNDLVTPTPPDGGLTAWLQVVGAFFLFFASWGFVNAFGAYQNYYSTETLKSTSESSISWIGSLQPFLLMLIGTLTGPLYDKGYFYHLVIVGAFLVTFGIMMTSIASHYYQFVLAQGLCIGIGTGCFFIPSMAVVASYFSKHRSVALGLASTGGSVGGLVYSVAFRQLVDKIGFGWATRFLGFLTLLLLILSLAVMRPLQGPKTPTRKFWLPSAFKEPPYTLVSVGFGFTFMGLYMPYFYIQGYAAELLNLDRNLSYQLLTIMNVSSTVGRVIPAMIADRVGPINVMIPSALGTGLVAYGWIGMRNEASVVVFAVLYGFLSGTVVSMPPTTIASIGGRIEDLGTRLGMSSLFTAAALLMGNPIGGSLIEISAGKFRGAQIYCGSFLVAGTAMFLLASWALSRSRRKLGMGNTDSSDLSQRDDGPIVTKRRIARENSTAAA